MYKQNKNYEENKRLQICQIYTPSTVWNYILENYIFCVQYFILLARCIAFCRYHMQTMHSLICNNIFLHKLCFEHFLAIPRQVFVHIPVFHRSIELHATQCICQNIGRSRCIAGKLHNCITQEGRPISRPRRWGWRCYSWMRIWPKFNHYNCCAISIVVLYVTAMYGESIVLMYWSNFEGYG